MRSQGLRTHIQMVADLDAAKAWYARAFETEPYFDEPFYVGFNISGYEFGLSPKKEPKIGQNSLAYWAVENVQESVAQLVALGATVYEEPQDVGSGIVVGAVLDPWGNPIGMIYNPHFKVP